MVGNGMRFRGILFFLIYILVPLAFVMYFLKLEINYLWLVPGFIVMILTYFAFGVKWKNFTSLVKNVKYLDLVKIEAGSKLMHQISPFQLDVPSRAYMLKKRDVSVSHSVSMSVFDLFTDTLLCVFIMIIVSANIVQDSIVFYGLVGLLVVLVIFILKYPAGFFRRLEGKFKNKFLKKGFRVLVMMPESVKLLLKRPRNVLYHFVAMMSVWLTRWIRMFFIFLAFGAVVPIEMIALAFCASAVATFITRIPSGIIVAEATGIVVLSGIVDPVIVLSVFLIDRLFTLITAFGLGFNFLIKEFGGIPKQLWRSVKGSGLE